MAARPVCCVGNEHIHNTEVTGFFLRIYDFLSGRKWLAALLAVLLAALCLFFASRLHYEEDISRFLPGDEESSKYSEAYNALGKKNNIILIFSAKDGSEVDEYEVSEAIHSFEEVFDSVDSTGIVPQRQIIVDSGTALRVMDAVASDYPLYLTEADYRRIDSLLAESGFVSGQLAADRQSLLFPTGEMMVKNVREDPLHLFSPVLQRLRSCVANTNYDIVDDCIFTKEGKGLAFLTSPYGTSESGMNSKVADLVDEAIGLVEAEHPDVTVSAVGAPLIAVSNAARIKKDSVLAISLALVLIGLLLVFTYKRFSDILWIVLSTAFGWVFAIGAIALIRDSMSIIVIGIASVIIGIAVNYPLHFMDGLKSGVSPRQNLKEMVEPLLIGNITTIAAFLCLVWLDAVAMQDLGLFGSLMLAGTIVFVLVFLPVFTKPRGEVGGTLELGRVLPDKTPSGGWLLAAVMAVTVVMYFLSGRTEFDSDMRNINYLTQNQKRDLAMLQEGLERPGCGQIYAIAEGGTQEEALECNDRLLGRLDSIADGRTVFVKGPGAFIPSERTREERIRRWESFWGGGKAERLAAELVSESGRQGFSTEAFRPFLDILGKDYSASSSEGMSALADSFDGTYLINDGDKCLVVNQVFYTDGAEAGTMKDALRSEGTLVFDTGDISNRLVTVLSESFDYIGLICSLVVFVFLCLSFRRLELGLLSFFPLAVSWFWILGIMSLLDIRFNIVNIILATFIFGQGDDYTIFITEGLVYEYAYGKKRLATYKNSVFHSAVIMFIGIGALVLARHPAMRSLGEVTVIGMFIVVVMACNLPPVIFRWLTEKKGRRRDVPLTLKRLVYSVYALVGYVLLMFIFAYPYTFLHFLFRGGSEDSRLRYHRFIQRMSRFLLRRVPGVRFSFSGLDNADFSKPSVVIANHQSHLDLICLMALNPKLVFLTNDWVWKNPIYGYVIRKAEYIPVNDGVEKNMDRIRALVERGYSLVVFPEGTRTPDGNVGRFHKGAFYVAAELGLDIVPVYIHGAYDVLPKSDFMLREGSVQVEVGARFRHSGDYRSMAKECRRIFVARYAAIRKELETPEYLSVYVGYKYLYKGADVEARSRKALSKVKDAGFLYETPSAGRFEIRDCGQGEYALIFALMHPDVEVDAYDKDEDNIMLASNCSCLPANLHYHIEL